MCACAPQVDSKSNTRQTFNTYQAEWAIIQQNTLHLNITNKFISGNRYLIPQSFLTIIIWVRIFQSWGLNSLIKQPLGPIRKTSAYIHTPHLIGYLKMLYIFYKLFHRFRTTFVCSFSSKTAHFYMLPSAQKFRIFIFQLSFTRRIFHQLEFWKCKKLVQNN